MKREEVPMRAAARTYAPGDRVGQLELLSRLTAKRPRGKPAIWLVRCDCGTEFARTAQKLSDNKQMCQACSLKDKLRRVYPQRAKSATAPCYLCSDLAHRVEGKRCRNPRCKLRFAEEPKARAEVVWQSSAGYALAFAHG